MAAEVVTASPGKSPLLNNQIQLPLVATASVAIVLAAFGLIAYGFSGYLSEGLLTLISGPYFFGVVSFFLLLSLTTGYLYAYRIYQDIFYLFIAIGWFANGLYLLLEFCFENLSDDFNFRFLVYLFSLLSTVPFYIAAFIPISGRPDYGRILKSSLLWAGVVLMSIILNGIHGRFGALGLHPSVQFTLFTSTGVGFSAWALFWVGKRLRLRLKKKVDGIMEAIFPWTFYLYALLQPLYLLYLIPDAKAQTLMTAAFSIAFGLKIVNFVSVMSILTIARADLDRAHERLRERSVLEELGILTASIEHEIKTPLAIMNLEICQMKDDHRDHTGVAASLRKLEESMTRIYAASQIVEFIRGDRAFFNRDSFMTKLDVSEAVRRAVKSVKRGMNVDPSSITIKVERAPLFIKAYRPILEQAITNVLKNSVEAIRETGRTAGVINVRVRVVERPERQVKVEIEDNGCGISPDNIEKVTTIFTTKGDRKPNSGIGMFITDRIMEVHDGKIEIESDGKSGTKVSLLFPEWETVMQPVPEQNEPVVKSKSQLA